VTVLDFACGTGTFLLEVFQRIFDNIGGPDVGRADLIVRDHLLKNVFGFEYLIAPYTIAHLKLSQYLKDQNHPLKNDERLQVFLTNTLEPIHPEPHFLLPAITAETEAAQAVKDQPILVSTDNPPYSGHSKNKGAWITAKIDGYKFTVETDEAGREVNKPLGERNPKWLNDDYVKFIRFAQLKMDEVPEGVVGIITNHSWLDNPTFRGMRQSLMRSFEQIYVFDLHGNAKKKERAPDGSKDENVFDIEQGVAISVFVKRPGLERGVWRGDLWGKRLKKYQATADGVLRNLVTTQLNPDSPNYLFLTQDADIRREYENGWAIKIMPTNSIAIVTGHDSLAYAFSESELRKQIRDFAESDPEKARSKYGLGRDTADWAVEEVQKDIKMGGRFVQASYRPFDERFTCYTGRAGGIHVRPRQEVMQHMLSGSIGLSVCRFVTGEWQHAFVMKGLADNCLISTKTKERGYVFPIAVGDRENISSEFRTFLDSRFEYHYTSEEIIGYIYAVLHAPTYRARYAEFLRIDFPRVPFAESADDFEVLSGFGWALVQAHLLRELPRRGLAAYHGKGDHSVEAVRYSSEDQAVAINKTQFFKPVPRAVWDFHIGGYQVLDKYLKSRKGRTLSLDEINHVGAIADSLAFTIEQMARIDQAYQAAFPDRG
jgi:predicted helicase